MRILFITSGSGKILNLIFKKKKIPKKKIFIYGDYKNSCGTIAKKLKIKILGNFKNSLDTKVLLNVCKKNKINYIILYSFIHKIDSTFLKSFKGQIFNSHHSILPAFRGKYFKDEPRSKYSPKKIFERCLEFGVNITGNTVHLVDQHLDNGQPILQSILAYDNFSKPSEIRNKLFKQEAECIKQFIIWLLENRLVKKKTKITNGEKYYIKRGKYKLNSKNPFIPNLDYNKI